MPVAWDPKDWWNWYMSKDQKKKEQNQGLLINLVIKSDEKQFKCF